MLKHALTVCLVIIQKMAASSAGGGAPGRVSPNPQLSPCMWCGTPLLHPAAPVCNVCSQPQKKCVNCPNPILPSYKICPYCGAPQHQHETKMCMNQQCRKPLFFEAKFCVHCHAPQDPVMLQKFLTAGRCISCSAQLFTPVQKVCHECGTPQHSQTSAEHSGQSMAHVHSPQWHPSQISQPASPQSSLTSNVPPSNPPKPSSSLLAEQQQVSSEQLSTKRPPESDGSNLAYKRSKTEQSCQNDDSQTFIEVSGAAVCQQLTHDKAQLTSPPIAASAQDTPQPAYLPSSPGTSWPAYSPASYSHGSQGTPQPEYPQGSQGTTQPGYLQGSQDNPQPEYSHGSQGMQPNDESPRQSWKSKNEPKQERKRKILPNASQSGDGASSKKPRSESEKSSKPLSELEEISSESFPEQKSLLSKSSKTRLNMIS